MTDEIEQRLLAWADRTASVRAVIVTSTRARPEGPPDELSDWDVIVAATDPSAFVDDLGWHAEIGTPLVRWGDEDELLGHRTWFRGVVYDDGSKVDFTVWPDRLLVAITAEKRLPVEFDYGYRVLHDPDGLTAAWPAPTSSAYVMTPPSEADYRAMIEEFWWGTTYVAKAVRRGELFFAARPSCLSTISSSLPCGGCSSGGSPQHPAGRTPRVCTAAASSVTSTPMTARP